MYADRIGAHRAIEACFRVLLGERAREKPGIVVIGEKSASHVRWIPQIRETFPEARFIHVVRDPRDVVASMLDAARSWARSPGLTARRAATLWSRAVRAGRAAEDTLPQAVLRVRYEDLEARGAEVVAQMLSFVGTVCTAESSAKILHRCRFTRYSGGRAPGEPGGEGRFYRLGVSGGWVRSLTDDEARTVESIAGEEMVALGYALRDG
jgi:hypothetical protein